MRQKSNHAVELPSDSQPENGSGFSRRDFISRLTAISASLTAASPLLHSTKAAEQGRSKPDSSDAGGGIGMALLEESLLEEKNGRYANADLAGYLIPTNADVPHIDVYFIDKPDTIFNPLGARGIGEIGITGIPAAIANAVYNVTLLEKGCVNFQFYRNEFCLWNWNTQR
jgi:hypothetical protein